MLHDIRTHLDFMAQSMTYLQNRFKASFLSGSETACAPELLRSTEATLLAMEELRGEATALKKRHGIKGGPKKG
jgi:hypothetical protein